MIYITRLYSAATARDKQRLAFVAKLYQESFPHSPKYGEIISNLIQKNPRRSYEVVLLLAEGPKGRIWGFSLFFYFRERKFAYLDYLISDPTRRTRGIGAALYEATRDHVVQLGGRGIFMDVPPDDKERLREPFRWQTNKKRLAFYERYDARPVINTLYDRLPTPANDGHVTYLIYDGLNRKSPLKRAELKWMMEQILSIKGGLGPEDSLVRKIIDSVKDDPVQFRPPCYAPPPPPPQGGIVRKLLDLVNVGDMNQIHHLKEKGYVERPARIASLLKGIEGLPVLEHPVRSYSSGPIRAVHDAGLLNFLAQAPKKLAPRELLYPNVFPIRKPERIPKSWDMQAGYYCIDTFTPLTAASYLAARNAVNGSLTGADLLLKGSPLVYVLCRPPGHHAERRVFGGFCYLNNAAIAAHHLSMQGRVAFLDIDFHHGNGSQNIFYDRKDVYFISIHGHPLTAYPYFSGYLDEKGEGEGLGFNRNFPLKPGTGNEKYLKALAEAVGIISRYKPDFLVVSVGFDFMQGDPTGSFEVTPAGVRRVGELLATLRLPTLLVQEGGYSLRNLRLGARGFIQGLTGL